MKPDEYCSKFLQWADLVSKDDKELTSSIADVKRRIMKSCLLDRMIYCGEGISQTPCPVHKGEWSGIHWEEQRKEYYARGCRCFMHKCGCTTGWQPDEHCGCGVKP